jgi:23S rRNA (uracil1939-C5)-methyltransferase
VRSVERSPAPADPAAGGSGAPTLGDIVEVSIAAIGGRGDGVASWGARKVYVPFTQPDDRLRVRLTARLGDGFAGAPVAWLRRQPTAAPRCSHFGICGGCQLQHLPENGDAAWKRDQVVAALRRRGLGDVSVEPTWPAPPACRRRARFAFLRWRGRVELGFRRRRGHRPVDLVDCAILLPEIVDLVAPLRRLLDALEPAVGQGEVQVTASAAGLDLLLIARTAPSLADREALAAFAVERDLARLSWTEGRGVIEPIAQLRPVLVRFGGVHVETPPDAFLQTSVPAEEAIRRAVRAAIGSASRVADLYAGCGTFALPLAAEERRVHAVEADIAMATAMEQASRRAGLAGRIVVEARDLERTPLGGQELADLEAVVLDPPRAGARAQVTALAGSAVAGIAMVSCQPASFARDARILVDGGHRLLWVRPIDAFTWSSRIELVGAFVREAAAIGPPPATRG